MNQRRTHARKPDLIRGIAALREASKTWVGTRPNGIGLPVMNAANMPNRSLRAGCSKAPFLRTIVKRRPAAACGARELGGTDLVGERRRCRPACLRGGAEWTRRNPLLRSAPGMLWGSRSVSAGATGLRPPTARTHLRECPGEIAFHGDSGPGRAVFILSMAVGMATGLLMGRCGGRPRLDLAHHFSQPAPRHHRALLSVVASPRPRPARGCDQQNSVVAAMLREGARALTPDLTPWRRSTA